MLRSMIVPFVFLALPLDAVAAQQPLTLEEVYELALERNQMLRGSRAAADAVAARQPSATLPPDPEIQLGVMNASLPGLRTDMPGAMLPSVQVMQMIPLPEKLRLNGEIARQSTEIARSAVDEMWWETRARAAMLFYEIYRTDRQLAVMNETLEWLKQFEQVAISMYSVGGGRQSDVLRAGVEVARMRADIARMRVMRIGAAARLNAILDRPPETVVPAVRFAPQPGELPPARELEAWAEESGPGVKRSRLATEQARTRETLARREKWPDLTVGVQYGQRPSEMGTERMGSVMVGFSVPIFAGRRQMLMRAEAAAMGGMAQAELGDARIQTNARIGELLAEMGRVLTLLTLYRGEVLPQAEANVASAFASYRVARVDFMTLLDAQMTLNQYQQERYALLAEYGQLVSELEMTIGRELPATTTMLEEDA